MNSHLVGKRIAALRREVGLSTAQLADLIGKSQATVSRIENARQKPNVEIIASLAKALRVHPFALLSDPPDEAAAAGGTEAGTADRGAGLPLGRLLAAGRRRARLDLKAAAATVRLDEGTLERIEAGYELPDPEVLNRLVELYPVDAEEVFGVAELSRSYPGLARRLERMTHLLDRFRQWLREHPDTPPTAEERGRLNAALDAVLPAGDEDGRAAERRAEYFSIGHLSDELLAALQDPEFHEEVEKLARRHRQDRRAGSEASGPEASRSAGE